MKAKQSSTRQKRMSQFRQLASLASRRRRQLRTTLLKPIKIMRTNDWQNSVQLVKIAADAHPANDHFGNRLRSSNSTVRPGWAGSTADSDSDPFCLRSICFSNQGTDSGAGSSGRDRHRPRVNGKRCQENSGVIREVVSSPMSNFRLLDSDDDDTDLSDSGDDDKPPYLSFEASQDRSAMNGTSISDDVFDCDSELNDVDSEDPDSVAAACNSGVTTLESESSDGDAEIPSESADIDLTEEPQFDILNEDDEENGIIDNSKSWEDIPETPVANPMPRNLNDSDLYKQTCRWFKAGVKTSVLVLNHPTSLPVVGLLNVRVIWGQVELHGHLLGPAHGDIPVYSPITHSHLVLRTHVTEDPYLVEEDNNSATLLECVPNESLRQPIEQVIRTGTVGLLVRPLHDRRCEYISRYFAVFNCKRGSGRPIPSLEKSSTPEFYFPLPSTINCLQESDEWRNILVEISSHRKQTGVAPRILITGGKSVGKSTLCRFTLNTLLNSNKKLLVMDCDPAQCEFTPAGLLSLIEVTEPCFGPGFTHQKSPLFSAYLGATDVSVAPDHYKACTERVWDEYSRRDELKSLPLIVNTMGFNRGIGLTLLVNLIHLVRPTHIIQISSSFHGRNNQKLTYEYVDSCQGWGEDYREIVFPYVHYHLRSAEITEKPYYSPKNLRQINLMSYLSTFQTTDEFLAVNQLQLYKVKWSSVGIHALHADVSNKDILRCFNASIVAMCYCDPDEMVTTQDPSLPKFFTTKPVGEWLGYGIIRAISMAEKCFYIISYLPEKILEKTNALLKGDGDVQVPVSLLLEQDVESQIPYLCRRIIPENKMALGNTRLKGRSFKMSKQRYQDTFPR